MVETLLHSAAPSGRSPKAVISPHAGFIYSGPIAANALGAFRRDAARIERLIVLGPSHRVPVEGMAVPTAYAFETPLGKVFVDDALRKQALERPGVHLNDHAHAKEHSLEVQLPFLQLIAPEARILPMALGAVASHDLADLLDALWGGEETRIVVSSDLSHYLPYDEARRVDINTCRQVESLTPVSADRACGATGINGFMEAARKRGMHLRLVDLRNSGDTRGPKSEVVGYAAFVSEGGLA